MLKAKIRKDLLHQQVMEWDLTMVEGSVTASTQP